MTSLDELPIDIQARDIALMRGLFESRLMTLAHASALYFDGKSEATKKRVQKLKRAGLLNERKRRLYEPSILYLTKKAFFLLSQQGHLTDYPRMTWEKLEGRLQVSDLTLRHELSVMDVKTAFATAIRGRAHLSLAEFTTWPRLSEFNAFHPATGVKLVVKPDGFIRVHEAEADGSKNEHMFFLEVDRSTEVIETLTNRVLCYLNYYRNGGFAARFGYDRESYRQVPFRVAIICKSTQRQTNIATRLLRLNPPVRTFVWIGTREETLSNPLSEVWVTPASYHHPTKFRLLDGD